MWATRHYYFSDHLGSSNVVTNATGATIEEESDFYPFGGERVLTDLLPDQRYKFTGKERDPESGLDYFGARYYSSPLGRFITLDWAAAPTAVPYAQFGDPQTLNLYGYVRNNPLSHVDADGHCGPLCGAILGGGAGAVVILYKTGRAYFTGKGHIPTNKEIAKTLLTFGAAGATIGAANSGASPKVLPSPNEQPAPSEQGGPKKVVIDPEKSPEAAKHVEDAQAAGHPDELTMDRPGAPERRKEALAGTDSPQSGHDRDEYPPACCAEGGAGASIREIRRGDNRSGGAQMRNQIRDLPNGSKIKIEVKKKKPDD